MNLASLPELERYFQTFKNESKGKKLARTAIVLCPPVIHLKEFVKTMKSKKISIGAQNVFWQKSGPFTGEISASMAKNSGAEYALVGHSERKAYFGETDEMINLKLKAVLKERMTAVFCFGETLEERGAGLTSSVVTRQLLKGLEGITSSGLEKILFVYEPVWAVGTDSVPSSNGIMEIKILVRKILAQHYGMKYSQKAVILYGGSAKEKTMHQVCVEPGMDGVLVGRESLDPFEFLRMGELLNNC